MLNALPHSIPTTEGRPVTADLFFKKAKNMLKYPRHLPVDIKKYSPTTNNPEAYYGLPQNVRFCQQLRDLQPAAELGGRVQAHQATARRRRSTSTTTASATPAASPRRSTARSTGTSASAQLRELCDKLPPQRRPLRLPRAGLRRQGQLLRRAHAEVQVRHAPAHGDLGAAHLHRLGLEELPGLDPRRLRQLPASRRTAACTGC